MENIQNQLNEIKELISILNLNQKEFLTIEEASTYLDLSKSRLYKLTSNKEIPFYSPGGKKIYFKKSDLDKWIFNSKISTSDDFESEVKSYIGRTNKI